MINRQILINMTQHTLVLVTVITVAFFVSAGFVGAETATVSPATTSAAVRRDTVKAEITDQRVTALKEKADKEIERRITALNELIKKIAALKKLPASDKATFTTQIQAEITNLTNLKTKIDADTDIITLRADVKSIVSTYRIFALFLPKIHILVAADMMSETIDRLSQIATKLQVRIQEAKSTGANVIALEAALADMQAKLTDAQKQFDSIETNITSLTPDGYPGNKSTLVNARGLLKTGRLNLIAAQQDAQVIIKGLRVLKVKTPTASASATTN